MKETETLSVSPAEHSVPDRLTLADYAEILAAGTEAAQYADALGALRTAKDERVAYYFGPLPSFAAANVVRQLIDRGHPYGLARRVAIQVEQRSITVIAPAEGWRADGR